MLLRTLIGEWHVAGLAVCAATIAEIAFCRGLFMAEVARIAALLEKTTLLGPLDPGLRERVCEAMREVSFRAGQLIFSRGDAGTHIYLVVEGRIRLSVLTSEGRELSFAHAVPGDIFGEIAVLDRSTRSADATSLTGSRLMALPAPAVDRLIAEHPALARAFMTFLCARLRDVSDHLEHIALLPIEARLARYLLATLPEGAQSVALGMSQGELAMLLGASRPKVNAALVALEDAGAIERQGQMLRCDREVLGELARQD